MVFSSSRAGLCFFFFCFSNCRLLVRFHQLACQRWHFLQSTTAPHKPNYVCSTLSNMYLRDNTVKAQVTRPLALSKSHKCVTSKVLPAVSVFVVGGEKACNLSLVRQQWKMALLLLGHLGNLQRILIRHTPSFMFSSRYSFSLMFGWASSVLSFRVSVITPSFHPSCLAVWHWQRAGRERCKPWRLWHC